MFDMTTVGGPGDTRPSGTQEWIINETVGYQLTLVSTAFILSAETRWFLKSYGLATSKVGLLLFYATATVFQLYRHGDIMYEMMRKPGSTLLPMQGTFNLPHHIGIVWEEPAFDDAVSYTQWGNGLQHS